MYEKRLKYITSFRNSSFLFLLKSVLSSSDSLLVNRESDVGFISAGYLFPETGVLNDSERCLMFGEASEATV